MTRLEPERDETAAREGLRNELLSLPFRNRLTLLQGLFEGVCRQDMEEIVQDTLLAASRKLRLFRYGGPKELFAWAAEIGKNSALDRIRENEQRQEVPLGSAAGLIPAPPAGKGWRAPALPCRMKSVHAFLRSLPPQELDAITLADIKDLTIQEAADMLGRSYGAVTQARHRALAKLRALIAAHPEILERSLRK